MLVNPTSTTKADSTMTSPSATTTTTTSSTSTKEPFMIFGVRPGTASLCLVAITHTYLLFHCSPYVGYMAVTLPHHWNPNGAAGLGGNSNSEHHHHVVTVDNVGWYAGWLGTAFTTGRCLSFVPWKWWRHHNNKSALLTSLALSTICSLWFGLSETFVCALLARFCLGLSNTLSVCVKRIAIDHARIAALQAAQDLGSSIREHEEDHHHRRELAPSKVLGMMWWGSAIGPVVGGMLSNPGTFHQETLLPDRIEKRYPFFLPNFVAAVFCIVSMIGVYFFIDTSETDPNNVNAETTSLSTPGGERRPLLSGGKDDDRGDNSDENEKQISDWDAFQIIWKGRDSRQFMLAYWTFSFVAVCINEGLPLFLIARLSGPGLSPLTIGWILSLGAVQSAFRHTFAVDRILSREGNGGIGLYPSLRVISILGSVPSVLVPVMLVINGGTYFDLVGTTVSTDDLVNDHNDLSGLGEPGHINIGAFIFLVILVGACGTFSSMYFALIGVAGGRTVPPRFRDQVARIDTLGALFARAVAPVVAGGIVAAFMTTNNGGDAVWLWCVFGLLFGMGAVSFTFQLHTPGGEEGSEETAEDRSGRSLYLNARQGDREFAKLWEVHYDKGSETVGAKWRRIARKAIVMNRMKGDPSDATDIVAPKIKKKPIEKISSWSDHFLRPGMDVESVPFFILGMTRNDKSCWPNVLTPPLMGALQRQLPMSHSYDNFFLKFSMVRDGSSFFALEAKIMTIKNTILAIETLDGDVFGCFMSKSWRRTNRYEMGGESFLWRMKLPRLLEAEASDPEGLQDIALLEETAKREEDIEVYRWTGETDDCQLFGDDRLAAGGGMVNGNGGFGFILDGDLTRGVSGPSLAYGNPPLVSNSSGRFEVANLEVWTMTPFLFASEAEKAEKSLRFIHENLVNPHGDKASAAHSAWTSFL